MPRRQKSKVRAREKRHQAWSETQGLHDQATTSRGEETTSSSPPDSERVLPQARLLLAPPRGLREPKAPPVLLQVLYPKDLVVVAQQARDLVVVAQQARDLVVVAQHARDLV